MVRLNNAYFGLKLLPVGSFKCIASAYVGGSRMGKTL